jgi:hypothetical protein
MLSKELYNLIVKGTTFKMKRLLGHQLPKLRMQFEKATQLQTNISHGKG